MCCVLRYMRVYRITRTDWVVVYGAITKILNERDQWLDWLLSEKIYAPIWNIPPMYSEEMGMFVELKYGGYPRYHKRAHRILYSLRGQAHSARSRCNFRAKGFCPVAQYKIVYRWVELISKRDQRTKKPKSSSETWVSEDPSNPSIYHHVTSDFSEVKNYMTNKKITPTMLCNTTHPLRWFRRNQLH